MSAPRTYPVVRFVVAGSAAGAPAPALRGDRPWVVAYDGDCQVCTRLAGALRRWDRTGLIEVVPSRAPGVREAFPSIPAEDYDRALQLVHRDGRRWQGSAAIEQILRVVPKGRLVAWVFAIPGVRRVAEMLYAWFARNRYRLGCGEHCRYRPPAGD